jgi:hypothetical protein
VNYRREENSEKDIFFSDRTSAATFNGLVCLLLLAAQVALKMALQTSVGEEANYRSKYGLDLRMHACIYLQPLCHL